MRLVRFLLVLLSLAALPAVAAEVIVNGAFDNGVSPWVEASTGGYPIVTTDANVAHSGNSYAWLGGYESGVDILSQDITIPPDAGVATLSFWHLINVDAQTFNVSDTMEVRITDPSSGAVLARLATFSNLDVTGDWVPTPQYDVSVFRGRAVRLQFVAANDAFNVTSFLIDDVTLTYGPSAPRLANISTRGEVFTGNDVMIAGFIIGGTAAKTVVINVAGPSLVNFGIANPLTNPTLTLVRSSDNTIIASNDNWQSQSNPADVSAIQNSGFAPANAFEPAIMMSLAPGAYTAIVGGVNGGTGVALIGLFEVDHIESPLINISTRGQVLTGNDVMIAGFIIRGSSPQTVVVNVAGPTLANYGITNPLANPQLTLVRSSDNAVIATNDNWQSAPNAAQIQSSGFAPANSLEPAIMMTLAPGAYTAIVSGVNGGTGVGLVGVFAAQ